MTTEAAQAVSPKSRIAVVLLAFFLGQLGIHRFYVGKVGTGVAQLVLTVIGYVTILFIWGIPLYIVGIWVLIDFIMALVGKFKDKDGAYIITW